MKEKQLVPQIKDSIDFIDAFRKKEESLIEMRLSKELPAERLFVQSYKMAEAAAAKLIESHAPKFNIFDILLIKYLEAKVHTPFLAELINPEGRHGQGRLFFNAFMEHLFPGAFDTMQVERISIVTELSDYLNGRMDIVITYEESRVRKEIVIENKIYHHDELQQLTRYYTYLTQTKKLPVGNFHLVYLTPFCTEPNEGSIDKELFLKLTAAKAITCWGYYENILVILEKVLPTIKADVVYHTVQQYIQSIQDL